VSEAPPDPIFAGQRPRLLDHLKSIYHGVFTDEAIEAHLENHVCDAFAGYAVEVLRQHARAGARVLDIGCGFGSFVLAARDAGFDAVGVEIEPFEVEFARTRLQLRRPQDDSENVYLCGDVRQAVPAGAPFDVITLWNVIEHVADWNTMLDSAIRLLAPDAVILIICPNYQAWRQEAHYHIPWFPALRHSREKAIDHIRAHGRDPAFFRDHIFCRTNREVQRELATRGFSLHALSNGAARSLGWQGLVAFLRAPKEWLSFWNPYRASVELAARRGSGAR
jgi:MPBQ/MSBQ methyltransferase